MKRMSNRLLNRQSGQSLVLLLFFVLMAMTFTATAIILMVVGSGSITTLHNGIETRQIADSAAEDALLRLIRDPFYAGETYNIGDVAITISVTNGATSKTVNAQAVLGDATREVEVLADYTDNVLRVTSWREIY